MSGKQLQLAGAANIILRQTDKQLMKAFTFIWSGQVYNIQKTSIDILRNVTDEK